jgi:iron complex transport system substrate-binding protein
VKALPVCTAPRFDVDGSSAQVDERVKSVLAEGLSVYRVDGDLLRRLRPDAIITQSQCEVCAVSLKDVELSLSGWQGKRPQIVTLSPNALADVWDDIRRVAEALGVAERGRDLVQSLQERMNEIKSRAETEGTKPTIACVEWVDPLMAAGNWMPELVELAGGANLFGSAGEHAPWMTWDQLKQADPDVVVVLPCGLDLRRTRQEMPALASKPGWSELRAVRAGRVFLTDGNQYFNRPGPRLVESLEILAELLHPTVFPAKHRGKGWESF